MPNATIIPFEPLLPQVLPTIEGNVDYRLLRAQLLRIDELLRLSGLESLLIRKDLQRWLGRCKKPAKYALVKCGPGSNTPGSTCKRSPATRTQCAGASPGRKCR